MVKLSMIRVAKKLIQIQTDESGDDLVIDDTQISDEHTDTESSDSDMDTHENDVEVEDIFTTTRSGRITTNWRALNFT
ncbi:Hypothetical predicted protein [Paramuricea clavata]|uniref:Uncharacterized protein n=1 Tax=Paramuricea clavata TaxID=317549 RepID=A0A6S7HAZ8_PARCT|nr:Hypothetical predicted protein [Paramuricea clavata]